MDSVRRPFEMPVLHTTPDDFGLSRPEANRKKLEFLTAASYKVLREDGAVLLGLAVSSGLGELFLGKKDELALTYYLRFEVKQIERLGTTATQVALWRRCAPGLEGGTSAIIYALLEEYDAIVGAPFVTSVGQRYWIDRMAGAYRKGFTVGLTDGDIVALYDDRRNLLDWVRAPDLWGDKDVPQHMCFFIAKKASTRDDSGRF